MRDEYPIKKLCNCLNVSTSAYYDFQKKTTDKEFLTRQELIKNLAIISYQNSRRTYGHRQIRKDILKKNIQVSFRSILKIMKENALLPVPSRVKPYPSWEDMGEHKIAPNRLNKKFDVNKPDRYWAGDITYIRTTEGWLYLAVVIDLFSRAIVGWATSENPNTKLVLKALNNALIWRRPRRWRIMFHSDQGCQYTSKEYCDRLHALGILQSMSRRGQCWDNAVVESFFGTFKQENHLCRMSMGTKQRTRELVLDWIENWYNSMRQHSKLNYCSPADYEQMKLVA